HQFRPSFGCIAPSARCLAMPKVLKREPDTDHLLPRHSARPLPSDAPGAVRPQAARSLPRYLRARCHREVVPPLERRYGLRTVKQRAQLGDYHKQTGAKRALLILMALGAVVN